MAPLNLFISYSHQDDSSREKLEGHLKILKRQGILDTWNDRAIEVGQDWEEEIRKALDRADIVLLLISSDFLASDFCYGSELKRAMARHRSGDARVVPVFLRACDWKDEEFGKLQGVPDNAKPVSQWDDRDQAFTIVAKAIRKAAETISTTRSLKENENDAFQVDFGKIHDLIDWDRVRAKVIEWASKHNALDPFDMGPSNYQKCLFDLGLGGKDNKLEWEQDGHLKYR